MRLGGDFFGGPVSASRKCSTAFGGTARLQAMRLFARWLGGKANREVPATTTYSWLHYPVRQLAFQDSR
jgi:hypothetical protein